MVFFYLANKKGQNNSSSLSACYKEKLHNAANYSSEQEWLAALEQEFAEADLPEISLIEPQVVYTVAAGDVICDCGSFYIAKDGLCVTERSYDLIIKDLNTGKLTATAYGCSTPLADDGSEEHPILNQIAERMVAATDVSDAFSYGLQMLQADPFDAMGYKAITYYNMAVFFYNYNDFGKAKAYLESALEVNPELTEAKESLALLESAVKEADKAERKARRKLLWECIQIGAQGVSDAVSNLASIQQSKQARADRERARKAANKARNKERKQELKEQGKTIRHNMVGIIGSRSVSNQYTSNVGMLTDMKNNGMYGTPEFRALQKEQQRLSKEYGITSHESEIW